MKTDCTDEQIIKSAAAVMYIVYYGRWDTAIQWGDMLPDEIAQLTDFTSIILRREPERALLKFDGPLGEGIEYAWFSFADESLTLLGKNPDGDPTGAPVWTEADGDRFP
jgi:hypothetical protein